MKQAEVLLVEQDTLLADMYAMTIGRQFDVHTVRDSQGAIDALDQKVFDCVITDSMLGEHNGIELIHELKSYDDWQSIPVILLSSVPLSHISYRQWRRYGICSILYKPETNAQHLLEAITQSISPRSATL